MIAAKCQNNDDIRIFIIKPEDRQCVLDFLRVYYYLEEPLASIYQHKQQVKADEDFNLANIDYGTCLMAIQEPCGNIVGVSLTGSKGPDEAEHLFGAAAKEGPTKWGTILHFLVCVERDANVFKRYGVDKTLHIHLMAVDQQMRGKHISDRLINALTALAKDLHYETITMDCTSYYSAKICERLGAECVNTVYYKDYLDANKKQVFTPQPPHECCKTFVSKL